MTIHPQPIGVFAAPATYVLLPDVEAHADLVAAILDRGAWPSEVPAAWAFVGHLLDGDPEAAYAAVPDGPEAAYNRFLLAPSEDGYAALAADASGAARGLVQAVGTVYGYETDPLADPPEAWAAPLRAFVLATRAGRKLRAGETEAGLADLEAAEEAARGKARAVAARLVATRARTLHELQGPSPTLVALYQRAEQELKQTAMTRLHGLTLLGLGGLYQEMAAGQRHLLLEAARAYQRASQIFTDEADPERRALALNNLALAYLAVPLTQATDKLRTAIAVQALRDALEITTRETHPEEWAATTLNLANALQHAPSGDPEGHLWQAVELYEEVLEVRTPEADPGGHARTLANQANALAHLGAFSRAIPRFIDARDRFRQLGDADAAETVDVALAEIAAARELPAADNA
ncbi:MAG: tetratricopeptide repeat protein [Bacteroidota bacterium]